MHSWASEKSRLLIAPKSKHGHQFTFRQATTVYTDKVTNKKNYYNIVSEAGITKVAPAATVIDEPA